MILLTGCTGFLGSRLLHQFLSEGEDVVGLKRSTSLTSRIDTDLGHPRLHLYDVDREDVGAVFAAFPIDTVVHAATQYGREATPLHTILEANLILPLRLAELGIANGTRCFINTDSYFNKNNSSYSSLLDYALSKKSLLDWLRKLSPKIRVVNVMLEHIYGPHDSPSKFVEGMIRRIAIDRVTAVALTHGHQKRDFVYLDDVVAAFVKVVEYGRSRDFRLSAFEIGTGESTQVRDFALAVKRLSGSPTELGFGEIPYRNDEIMTSVADLSALRELGCYPTVSVEKGIATILAEYGVAAHD